MTIDEVRKWAAANTHGAVEADPAAFVETPGCWYGALRIAGSMDRDGMDALLCEAAFGGKPLRFGVEVVTEDGYMVWFEFEGELPAVWATRRTCHARAPLRTHVSVLV